MKKILLVFILLILVVCLTACSQDNSSNNSSEQKKESAAQTVESSQHTESVATGNVITFGRYEQDNDLSNGSEPIEWIVLDVQDGKALLLSRYGLEAKPYNTEHVDITWEECTLRGWLNGEFLNAAFSADEQSIILITVVDNSASQCYSDWKTTGGNNTQDRIFVLSYAEANKYLDVTLHSYDNIKALVSPTEYATKNGARIRDDKRTAEGKPAGWWWLRSPGDYQSDMLCVYNDGSLSIRHVNASTGVVRPSLWVNLESGIF